jgi:hypothetical protein
MARKWQKAQIMVLFYYLRLLNAPSLTQQIADQYIGFAVLLAPLSGVSALWSR